MNNEFENEIEELSEQPEVIKADESVEVSAEYCKATEEQELQSKTAPRTVKLKTLLITGLACLLVGAIASLLIVPNKLRLWMGGSTAYDKLAAIEEIVENNFIYMDEVDDNQVSDMLAWGYIYGLGDPFSAYFDASQFDTVQSTNAGQSYGIGVSLVMYEEGGGIYVAAVTPNSPADLGGIKKGDIITAVDAEPVTVNNYSEMVDAIRGEAGTTVRLDIMRGDSDFMLEIVRGEFVAMAVSGEMIDKVGYIKIITFNDATAPQFKALLDSHIAAGAESLVIDLRDNTGGLVNAASDVLDMLLPECDLGYAVYKDGTRKVMARSDKSCVSLPMSVIINGVSASSSEYFAAALRDVAGAKLIGEKSFGKGIMQTTFPLGDGSAVRVTVAEIYTADNKRYHGKGLEPDVPAGYTEEQKATWFLLEGKADPFIAAAIKNVK